MCEATRRVTLKKEPLGSQLYEPRIMRFDADELTQDARLQMQGKIKCWEEMKQNGSFGAVA